MTKNIGGLNINYIDSGEGPLVVLLHGWGCNVTLFNGITELLQNHYRVVAPDFPGFGQSDEPKEPWDVDAYVDFTLKFISEFAPSGVILLGHSFGGRVIIKLANRPDLPFKIDKIILTGSAGIKPKMSLKGKLSLRAYKIGRSFFSTAPMKKLFPDMVEKMRKKRGSADYNNATPMMRQCFVKIVNEDLTQYLSGIKPPTLLVWGENDADTPLADGRLMEKLIDGSGLVVLKNAAHYAFLEQAYTFNKVLASFLNIK